MSNEKWGAKADCRNHPSPNLWFPEKSGGSEAKKICEQCPARRPCGQDAIDRGEQFSVAAGFKMTDADERNRLRQWLGLPPEKGRQVICSDCGELFETHRVLKRCPACSDMVDAGPAAAWVRGLKAAGMSWRDMAIESMVSPTMLRALVGCAGGRVTRHIARDSADRILAISVPERAMS